MSGPPLLPGLNAGSTSGVTAFIQARMSSRRFPGKMLAPFRGRPLIQHVVERIKEGLPDSKVVVLTSTEPSDDPLAFYLERQGVLTFRGPLDNVFERFRQGLVAYPSEWVLRICADSPLLSPALIQFVACRGSLTDGDIITTNFPRTTPKGTNAELIRSRLFEDTDQDGLTPYDKEHVTPFFYRNRHLYRVFSVMSMDSTLSDVDLCVDTIEGMHNLEVLPEEELQKLLQRLHPLTIT